MVTEGKYQQSLNIISQLMNKSVNQLIKKTSVGKHDPLQYCKNYSGGDSDFASQHYCIQDKQAHLISVFK